MREFLESDAGHIVVVFLIFLVGVGLLFAKPDASKEIIGPALASLFTVMRIGGNSKS